MEVAAVDLYVREKNGGEGEMKEQGNSREYSCNMFFLCFSSPFSCEIETPFIEKFPCLLYQR